MFKIIYTKSSELTTVEVDTTPETFIKHGFLNLRSGDKVVGPHGLICVIQGFGLLPMTSIMVLWYIEDGDFRASYCNKDTKEEKFTPI